MQLTPQGIEIIAQILNRWNSAKFSDLPKFKSARIALRSLLSQRIVKERLQSQIRCPTCANEMEERLGMSLFCRKCKSVIDLTEESRGQYYTYSIEINQLSEALRDYLCNNGFDLKTQPTGPDLAFIHSIGHYDEEGEGPSYDYVYVSKPLDDTTLYALLGYSVTSNNHVVAFYPSLAGQLDIRTADFIAMPRMRLNPISDFLGDPTRNGILDFQEFAKRISSKVAAVDEILQAEQSLAMSPEEVDFLENAMKLARTGREKFEPVALRLLQTIGITSRLKLKGYGPEGALYLPDCFYIVDAKSTESYFKFRIEERDKMRRYIKAIEDKSSRLGEYSFYGEVVVTPSLPEPVSDVLDKVEDYFVKNPIQSRLVVIAVEGLITLYRSSMQNMEFFLRRNLREHPIQLLETPYTFQNDNGQSRPTYTKVAYIDECIIEGFFKRVMESPIPDLDGRNKEHLSGLLINAYSGQ